MTPSTPSTFAANDPGPSGWRHVVTLLARAAPGTRLGRRAFWIFQAVFWLLSALSLAGLVRYFYQVENLPLIVAGRVVTGVVLTGLLHYLYQHSVTQRMEGLLKLLWICGLNAAAVLAGAELWVVLIDLGLPELPAAAPFSSFASARLYSLFTWNLAYFGIELLLNYHAVRLEASEARGRASAAELKQLQSQLNPHFLFNALNTVIASLEPQHRAREIVHDLADYLRFTLHDARPLEPLGRELDALESYLGLQRARFQNGVECRIEASPAAMRVLVPPMLVQPLFENAFKYGPLSSSQQLSVRLTATVVAGWLEIEVRNSGRWVTPGSVASSGSGLVNLRRRLLLLLGERVSLIVVPSPEFVKVIIRIPADSQLELS